MQKIPLLSQIFEQEGEPSLITLANLSQSLNVPIDRLEPLCEHGWIKLRSQGKITSQSYVEAPSGAALRWMRQWFQPLWDKPMFSQQDMAQLLNVEAKLVLEVAAAHDAPVIYDPGFGHMFSVWSAKTLLAKMLGGGRVDSRFDRQAMIWNLLDGDPRRVGELPKFDEQLEIEIERVAKLEEPMRSMRSMALVDQFRDAQIILESAEHLSCEQSRPELPACESSPIANAQMISACEQKLCDQL
jgi:hypothetical protein